MKNVPARKITPRLKTSGNNAHDRIIPVTTEVKGISACKNAFEVLYVHRDWMCCQEALIRVVTNKKWDSMLTKAGKCNHQTIVPSRSWVHCDGEGGNKLDQGGGGLKLMMLKVCVLFLPSRQLQRQMLRGG